MNVRGEGSVKFDPKRETWFAEVPIGRNRFGKTTFRRRSASNRREAERALHQLVSERGSSFQANGPRLKPLNFQEFALLHLDGEARNDIREVTRLGYLYILEKYVFDEFGAKKLDELNSQEITAFLLRLRISLSASQVNNVRAAMSRVYQSALNHQLISDNPMRRTKRMRTREGDKTTCQQPWSLEECKKAMETSVGTDMDAFVHVLVLTGVRLGECLGLKWSDIDLTARTIRIQRTLVELRGSRNDGGVKGAPTFGPPKTPKSVRTLTFGQQLHDSLIRNQQAQEVLKARAGERWTESDCIFTTTEGGPVWPSNFTAKYRKFLKGNGLRHQNPHALRHAFACNGLTLGVDLPSISRALGHASLAVTLDIYGRDKRDLQDLATATLSNWFEGERDEHGSDSRTRRNSHL